MAKRMSNDRRGKVANAYQTKVKKNNTKNNPKKKKPKSQSQILDTVKKPKAKTDVKTVKKNSEKIKTNNAIKKANSGAIKAVTNVKKNTNKDGSPKRKETGKITNTNTSTVYGVRGKKATQGTTKGQDVLLGTAGYTASRWLKEGSELAGKGLKAIAGAPSNLANVPTQLKKDLLDPTLATHRTAEKRTNKDKTSNVVSEKLEDLQKPVQKAITKGTKKVAKTFEKGENAFIKGATEKFSDEEKELNIPVVNKYIKGKQEKAIKQEFDESYDKEKEKYISDIVQYGKENGFTDDTPLNNGMTWGEYSKMLASGFDKNYKNAKKEALKSATGTIKMSEKDIVETGVKGASEMLDYVIPYGATTKGALKASKEVVNATKLSKAPKIEKTIQTLAEQVKKGTLSEAQATKLLKKANLKIKGKAIASNVASELIANAMQDVTVGTGLDYVKARQQGLKGDELKDQMLENAKWNVLLGGAMSAVAGKGGAKEAQKVMANATADSVNDALKFTAKDARELLALDNKARSVGLNDAETIRKAELTTKATGTGGVEVNGKGKLVQRSTGDISDVLSKEEVKEYIDLNTRATSGARLSPENQGKLNALNVKVENARKILETNANNSLKGKVKAKNVDALKQSVKYFERIGDSKKLKQAQKRLDEAVKLSEEKIKAMVDTAKALSGKTGTEFKVVSPDEIAKAGVNPTSHSVPIKDENGNTTILLNAESPRAHQSVAGHEVGRLLKEANEEEYNALGKMLTDYASEKGELRELVDEIESAYGKENSAEFNEALTNEMIARYIFGDDDRFIKKLTGEKPTIAERIKGYIKDFINKTNNTELQEHFENIFNAIPQKKRKITETEFSEKFANGTISTDEISTYIKEKHNSVYENNEEALKLTADATADLQKVHNEISREGNQVGPSRVIGDAFSRDFINKGYVDFRGTEVKNVADLAESMQVFRDPRYETFRIVYMKGDTIVATEGITTRMAGFTKATQNDKSYERQFYEMSNRMKRLGSDGYYLVHNHPSGVPEASLDDFMTTLKYKRGLDGYKGHVIIDHDKYGVIDVDNARQEVFDRTGDVGDDILKKASVEHPFLGAKISNSSDLTNIMKRLENDDAVTTIVYCNSKGKITGIENVSNAIGHDKGFRGYVKNNASHFGATDVFIGTKDAETTRLAKEYILDGTLTDCIHYGDNSFSVCAWEGISKPKEMAFGKQEDDYIGKRVSDNTNSYKPTTNVGSFISSTEAQQFEFSLAERLKNGEDIDTLFDDAYKFIKDKTPKSYEEPVVGIKELRDARRLMRTTDIRVTTTDVTKGLSINRLLENVGYDKKTIGSKIKLKKNSGISIETAYHRLQEVDANRFPDLDTEEDMLRKMCDVAMEDTRSKQTIEIPDKDYDEMIKQEASEMLERAFAKNQSAKKVEEGIANAKPVSKKAQEESIQTSTEGEKADILRDAKVSNKPVADLSTEALNKEYKSLGFGIKNGKTEEHIKLRKDRQAEIKAELEKRGEFEPAKSEQVDDLISNKGYGWEKAKEYKYQVEGLRNKEKELKAKISDGGKAGDIKKLNEELAEIQKDIRNTTKKLYDTVDQSKSTFDEGKDILEQAKERGGGNTVKVNKATWKDLVKEEETTRLQDGFKTIRRLFEASLIDFETTGKKLMRSTNAEDRILGRQLLDQTNSVYTARNRSAYMVEGKNGLNDAFTVEYKGKKVDLLTNDEMREDLSNYLFYKHAIGNRHELNKDVFGQRYTQKDLVDLMGALEDKYGKDVLESFETNIRGYIDKLNQYRLDAGLITEKQLEKLEDIYPYYVPTNRVGLEKVSNYEMPTGSANIDNGIKTAKGSDKPLEELYLQLVKMTDRTVKSSEQNRMMSLYARAKGFDLEELKKAKPDDIEKTSIGAEETTKGKWRVTFMQDGEKVTIPVNRHCAKGLREWNGQDFATLLNVCGKFSGVARPYKGLITDWNLIFGVRNGMRDQQQAIVNSSDSYWYSKSLPRTFASVNPKRSLKDSPFRELYEANGGKWSSIAQYNSLEDLTSLNKNGLKKANEKTLGKVIDQIENINGAIELTPRLTEFIGTLQKEADGILKKEGSSVSKLFDEIEASVKREGLSGSKLTEEIETRYANAIIDKLKSAGNFDDVVRTAMRNSTDITLNFSRSGVITKALNSGLFPYLNPSVQGLSKTMRLFTEGHTNGTLINFLMKLGVCTVAPSVVNELLLAGNEEYQSLNTRDKDMNFFIPCGDGQFIKIPKPRENAVLSEPFTYATRWLLDSAQYGTMEEMKQMFVSAKDNIGVIDAGDFIFAPLIKNFMQNQNWYGGKILNNQELRNEENNEAYKNYDESTSWVAKKLGKLINMSPKRIDNVMDSYMGLVYDLGISQTSEKAKNDLSWKYNPATVQFMKDSVFSNKYTTQFWDKADKLNDGAKGGKDTREYTEFMAKYGKDTFTYDNAISDIDTDKSIPKSVKADMKRELRKYKNALVKRGLDGKDVIYDPMQRIINVYEKYGVKNATDKALSTFAFGNHKDAYEYMKSTKEYRDASPKEKKALQQKFLNTYKGIKRIARNTGDSDDFINYSTVAYVCAKKGYTKGYIANCYCLKSKEYSVEKMITRAKKYIDAGYTTKNFEVTMRALNRGCDNLKDDDKRFASQLDDYDKAMILAEKGYRDGAYYISSQYLDSRMNAGRCLADGHSNGKFKWTDKRVNDFCNEFNIVHDKNYDWDNEYIVKCIKSKYGGKSMEEKAGLYQVITGDTENFPFGEIGDYSHKNDTGLEDGKKSGGRGGRRGRRGHGGGGSGGGKGTVPKTSSGAINGKVTNPFSSNTSSKSNLNDAYRKKLKKLREQTR